MVVRSARGHLFAVERFFVVARPDGDRRRRRPFHSDDILSAAESQRAQRRKGSIHLTQVAKKGGSRTHVKTCVRGGGANRGSRAARSTAAKRSTVLFAEPPSPSRPLRARAYALPRAQVLVVFQATPRLPSIQRASSDERRLFRPHGDDLVDEAVQLGGARVHVKVAVQDLGCC